MKLKLLAPAKINLFLDVLWKRGDGFHNIQSIMQTVSLSDRLTLSTASAPENRITLSCTDPTLPTDRANLAVQAAELYFERFGITGTAMDIFIEKHIPVGAGLGGGSADAAAVLTGLNQLFQYRAGILELLDAAAQLGSDVSFCLVGGTKITQKRGEAMTSVPSLPRCSILICPHICRISTKWAYAELDRLYGNQFTDREDRRAKIHAMLNALKRGELSGVTQNVYNIFEEAIFPLMPEVRETRDLLLTLGADTALMSGSGSSVFGIFTSTERAWDAKYRLETAGRPVCLCHPI